MKFLARVFGSRRRYERAEKLGRLAQKPMVKRGYIDWLPGMLGGWTAMRDAPPIAPQTFREWWKENRS